jgi:hypothetical protein
MGPLLAAPTKGDRRPRASALLLPTPAQRPARHIASGSSHATNGPIAFYPMALANLRRINR